MFRLYSCSFLPLHFIEPQLGRLIPVTSLTVLDLVVCDWRGAGFQ